ncbi:MAG: hypothetical protein R2941_15390 [Desulfobacterales bacterium]
MPDSIPHKQPALMRGSRISERAERTGFDWDNIRRGMEKNREEWAEFRAEVAEQQDRGYIDEQSSKDINPEFMDILFTLVNAACFARIHPEFRWIHIEKNILLMLNCQMRNI